MSSPDDGSAADFRFAAHELWDPLEQICAVGCRYVGSEGDRAIRSYLSAAFADAGLSNVRQEPVDVFIYEPECSRVSVGGAEFDGVGLQFTASALVDAPAIYLGEVNSEAELRASLARSARIDGHVVVVRSYFPFLIVHDLIEQGAVGVVNLSLADGGHLGHYTAAMYPCPPAPEFAGRPLHIPGVTLSAEDGRQLESLLDGKSSVTVRIEHRAHYRKGQSANVVGEVEGTSQASGHIILGAHHDTQLEGIGACDNGTGLATLLAAARRWAMLPTRRTAVFVAFADEEHGLYGATDYCKRHLAELEGAAVMFNLDAVAWRADASLRLEADPAVREFLTRRLTDRGWSAEHADPSAVPGADHVPFIDSGVPGVWLWRYPPQHPCFHTSGDRLELIDPELFADTASCAIDLARTAADHSGGFDRARPSRRWAASFSEQPDLSGNGSPA